ncbi:hypothetical protein HBA54_15240 [Pelagibius litoralis]|uniref:Uncharacterized protein n=1 Tax=Pelagibius litoralis TaxID=374515 RepID=A0A967K9L3_9PROT|nr:hypothetical protein [Pelagibius litoralis]NIA69957.1 hypothetical protein [Pelagibius litoralis]
MCENENLSSTAYDDPLADFDRYNEARRWTPLEKGLWRVISLLKSGLALLKMALNFVPDFVARLTVRRDSGPLDSLDSVCSFVSTRSAFVAQKTLYGYVKTRMGTRYPSMFENDVLISSVNIAKMNIFAACLSDLAIYAATRTLRDASPDGAVYRDLALRCFKRGLSDNEEQVLSTNAFSPSEALAAFEQRLAFQDWYGGLPAPELFTASPAALFKWAPIAPELKRQDKEIVENSIRFTWRDVRAQFEKRIDAAGVATDLNSFRLSRN